MAIKIFTVPIGFTRDVGSDIIRQSNISREGAESLLNCAVEQGYEVID